MNNKIIKKIYWNAIALQETFGNKLLFGDLNVFDGNYTRVLIPVYKVNKKQEPEFLTFISMTNSKGKPSSLRRIKRIIKRLLKSIEIEFECDNFKVNQHIEEFKYYLKSNE